MEKINTLYGDVCMVWETVVEGIREVLNKRSREMKQAGQ